MNEDISTSSLHERLGEERIAQLVDSLYEHMATLPDARTIWSMHTHELDDIKQRLRDFLSGFLGGPDHYSPKHGHPRMRQRHMGFSIGKAERDAWLNCMRQALQDTVNDEQLRCDLDDAFSRFADHMRNRQEGDRET